MSDDESESSHEELEESDDELDEEPALKYERILGNIPELLKKDSASALAISNNIVALGTHAGFLHILDLSGKRIRSYRHHNASIVDISMDSTGDWIGTASIDGNVVIVSLSTPTETYPFDLKRPMRTIALEPNFAKRSTRAFVCGGLAGALTLREKGWLGHKETVLHLGEGPVWQVRWRGRLIAWANDLGVKIYDTVSQSRITFIDRPAGHALGRLTNTGNVPPLIVEITAVFQLDCMVAGITPHPTPPTNSIISPPQALTSLLLLAYSPPDTFSDEMTEDRAQQARKVADRPELRIISRAGEELAADALSVTNFQSWGCNDYVLTETGEENPEGGKSYVIMSPRDLILVKPRDRRDHVSWLVERMRYEEALEDLEELEAAGELSSDGLTAQQVGHRYLEHLISQGDFSTAAKLCPKVCGQDPKQWETWIFVFAEKRQLQVVIPFVPTESPRLDHVIYEVMLAHFLTHDREVSKIYDVGAVIVAVHAELDRAASSSTKPQSASGPDSKILMECLADLYIINRQPGKALSYFLRLRRPNVFDLIRDNHLFTDVQDQVLLLVEFDHELMEKRGLNGDESEVKSEAIRLLVDNIHSIPIRRVVQQLEARPRYLFHYLDALVSKDIHLVSDFADLQVKLCAEYAPKRLIDFLRASTDYNLEKAYKVCQQRDLVLEMVFLLGHMGDNKRALTLIIERLGDVHRAIDFAKEQADDDLWEDLLKYSETRPAFIRGLLENVGPEINPIRLIRRIKNGLEIPGLKDAVIKILQDFHLQISLLDGCQTILDGDSSHLSRTLHKDQSSGFFLTAKTKCPICQRLIQSAPQELILLFLCRHVVHVSCVSGADNLPPRLDPILRGIGIGDAAARGLSGKIAFESMVRAKLDHGCPVCSASRVP
ncbi:vacuolar assembling protein VPS41 [Mycena floridula]|nr:vacuolar assembling protein VPS41 [Mycena floridula]